MTDPIETLGKAIGDALIKEGVIGSVAETLGLDLAKRLSVDDAVSVTETSGTHLDMVNAAIRQKRRAIDAEDRLRAIGKLIEPGMKFVGVHDLLRILEAE